ncbi:iron-siderophore ABC transporter substrate-binding protein [Ancylobacter sonchi]|uniref:iron-siderophore ABC transporter substrate-binding protein n=1 Tax=Ancylobacter sonchi TaxID=1937790 RepID=UPI0028AAFAAB|nr:iron-siderophore ABC transporter substrate-binding protein [Ancylobacter sonchi]
MSRAPAISRRALLAGGLASGIAGLSSMPARAASTPASRAATLDWALLETLLALGHPPVAATELVQFRAIAVEPPVPDGVADLGLRGLPNLETLLLARPDVIFNSSFYAALEPRLSRIAPVESFTLYQPGRPPYAPMVEMTGAVAARLDLAGRAEAFLAAATTRFAALTARLGAGNRPVLAVNFGDARHVRVFGFDSMIGEAMPRIGLANGWDGPTSYSAAAPVGLEALAPHGEAWIASVGPVPPDVATGLARNPFWQALPAVKAGRVLWLDPVDPFGALPSALRFARLLTEALERARTVGGG